MEEVNTREANSCIYKIDKGGSPEELEEQAISTAVFELPPSPEESNMVNFESWYGTYG